VCALALSATLVAACSRAPETDLSGIEQLAFVPAGSCVFWRGFGARVVCENPRPLLVDRFEVTRAAWRAWYEQLGDLRDPVYRPYLASWSAETSDWPASFMTHAEARAFAASRGMRLPGAREWMRIACGSSDRPYDYPWGGIKAVSVANTLELRLPNPLPVGTFEQGRTPLSIYDLAGNVWEWVDDSIVPSFGDATPSSDFAWAMGGSYLSHLRRLYDYSAGQLAFWQEDLDPSARSIDLGLRCCADAEEFITAHAARWGGERDAPRLRAIGAAWGHDAVPLLEELSKRPGAAPSLAPLLAGARQ
jgi:hypothetical protein